MLYTSLPVHGMSDKLGVPCATKQHQQKLQRQVTVRNNTCVVVCTWKNSSGDLIDIETSMSVAGIVCLLVTEKMVAMRSDKNGLWFHQTRYDIFELMPCKNMLGQAYQTFETQGKTLVRSHKLILYTSQQRHCIVRHFSSSNNTKRPPTLRLHEVHNITWDNMTYMEHHTQCFLHSLGKRWYVKSRYHVCRYIKQINKYLIPITANITMIVQS